MASSPGSGPVALDPSCSAKRFKARRFRTLAHDQEGDFRHRRGRADGEIVAFARNQPADRKHDRAVGVQAQLPARHRSVLRREQLQIHAVAENFHAAARHAQLDQPFAQRLGYRDHAGRLRCGPANQPPRNPVLGHQVHVRATRRDHHWPAETPTKQDRRHAVRIEIVRVDQVKAEARLQDLREQVPERSIHEKGRARHADLGQQRIAWMQYGEAVSSFLPRHPGEGRVTAKRLVLEREPRHRRDHHGGDLTALDQMTQSVLHEYTMIGRLGIGI